MTTREVADKLVELCKADEYEQAAEQLYAQDIVSIESCGDENMPARMQGMDAIRQKAKWFYDNHDVHRMDAEGPYMHGDDEFAVIFDMDVTVRPTGDRITGKEVAVYKVADGKIVEEKFYYTMD